MAATWAQAEPLKAAISATWKELSCTTRAARSRRWRRALVETGVRDAISQAMGVPIAAFGGESNQTFGLACGNYHIWMARIKAALDPHTASDPFFYADPFREQEGA